LLRKEILYLETDPRSAERGQYGFLQALVQRVAYETLSRRERKSRHLAAADFLAGSSGIDPSEIAEIIAAHYLDAYETDVSSADAGDVKASARRWFVRGAERARSLAAAAEAQRGFERAASLADDDADRARLLFRAGETALMAGDREAAERHLTDVIPIFGTTGLASEHAQASSKLGFVLLSSARIVEAVERMEEALAVFDDRGDEAAAATVAAQLARCHFFEGHRERALEYVERSLEVGEHLRLPEAVSQALNTKALLLAHRPYESIALMRGALEVARDHDVSEALSRGYINLAYMLWVTGASNAEIEAVTRDGLAYARRRGDRTQELAFVAQLAGGLFEEGRWDELEALVAELPEEMRHLKNSVAFQLPACLGLIAYHRGDRQQAAELIREWTTLDSSPDTQLEACRVWSKAFAALLEGRTDDVLAFARSRLEAPANTADLESQLDLVAEVVGSGATSLALGELVGLAEEADVPKPPSTVAGIARFRAKVETLRGEDEPGFERAVALLRESDRRVALAMTLVEQAEWLAGRERDGDAELLLDEAREIFEQLQATPWLERLDAVRGGLRRKALAAPAGS
jgi:tetratricopeptide (TPR) repeat protein